MELYWYETTCTECRSITELTYNPSGRNYADKYREFAIYMQELSWAHNAKGWRQNCTVCKAETIHQLQGYAPSYSGIE